MKTTVKVSISGIAFTIDEDAFQLLDNYLNTLKAHFNRKPDGKEVVDDIEARMAELLSMRISSPVQVVNLNDAKDVIHTMGNPSDLIGDEADSNPKNTPITIRKRLYRDPDNHVISGVCGGLSNYFGVDPVIFRLIFVICAIGVGILPFYHGFGYFTLRSFAIWTYIILWIAIPKAVTPQQKLEMTGKNPSIDEIERRVREEQNNNYRRSSRSGSTILGTLVRIFLIFVAGIFLFVGTVTLIAVLAAMFGVLYHTNINFNDIFGIVGVDAFLIKTLISIVIIYPLLMLIYWGSKLLFRFKLRDKTVMVIAFFVWLISVIVLFVYGSNIAMKEYDFRRTSMVMVESNEIKTNSDTLYLNMPEQFRLVADEPIGELIGNRYEIPRVWLADYEKTKTLFIIPSIKIRYSEDVSDFRLELRKKSFARNKNKAAEQVKKTKLNYTQTDSLLLISPMMFNKDYPLRKARDFYDIIIYAPNNKKVVIQEPLLSKSTDGDERGWTMTISPAWDDED